MSVFPQQSVLLYDADGTAMAVHDGVAIPANTSGLMMLGSDGANARFLKTNASGALAFTQSLPSTGTLTNVASSATNVTILAANGNRLGATIYNDSSKILYVKSAATASTTSFSDTVYPGQVWLVPCGYTGIIDGLWTAASGFARVTEYTP